MRIRAFGALAVLVAGCAGPVAAPAPAPAPAWEGEATRGAEWQAVQELTLPLAGDVATLDTALLRGAEALTVSHQLGEGLTRLDAEGRAVPGMAASWRQDGLSFTFTLRDGLMWSDGSPLTAGDFVFAWKRILDPNTRSPHAGLLALVEDVRAEGEKTLVVDLAQSMPAFAELTAMPPFFPQPAAFMRQQGAPYGTDAGRFLANGPFRLEGWEAGQALQLVRNDRYWGRPSVQLARVTFQVAPDPGMALNLYFADQIGRVALSDAEARSLMSSSEFQLQSRLATTYMVYNQRTPALANRAIRRAIAYSLPNGQLAEASRPIAWTGATGLVPAGTANGSGGDFRKDLGDLLHQREHEHEAAGLYAEGLKSLGLASLPALRLLVGEDAASFQAAEQLQAAWRTRLGLEVTVSQAPPSELEARARTGDFDMLLAAREALYNDPMAFLGGFTTGGEANVGAYASPAYDASIRLAAAEPDAAQRMRHLADAEKQIMADLPLLPLFYVARPILIKPQVKGLSGEFVGPLFDLKGVWVTE